MTKYLLLLIVFAIVWWIWKRPAAPPPGAARPDPLPECMVSCAHCGVNLPQSDALADGQQFFCNDAHRRAMSHQEK